MGEKKIEAFTEKGKKEGHKSERAPVRDWLCLLLGLIPTFGFFAFLFMAKKSGRKIYRRYGFIYAVLNALAILGQIGILYFTGSVNTSFDLDYMGLFSVAMNITMKPLPYPYYGRVIFPASEILRGLITSLFYIKTAIYFIMIVHLAISSRGYIRYMKEVVRPRKVADINSIDRGFRIRNSLWILWALYPPVAPLSIVYAGKRTGSSCMTISGYFMTVLNALIWAYMVFTGFGTDPTIFLYKEQVLLTIRALSPWVMVCINLTCILIAFLMREEVLSSIYSQYLTDVGNHPCMGEVKWCRANSRWLPTTFIPVAGGLGLVRAGVISGNRKILRDGCTFLSLSIIILLAHRVIEYLHGTAVHRDFHGMQTISLFLSYRWGVIIQQMYIIHALIWTIAGLTAFVGMLYYREVLVSIADRRGGYISDLDKEIAINKAWNKRLVEVQSRSEESEAMVRHEMSKLQNQLEQITIRDNDDLIDINTCSQSDFMRLPGVTLSIAMRAAEYREKTGMFTSVDHFIDEFEIKPHFAVQIMDMTKASLQQSEGSKDETERLAEPLGSRRRLDF